MTTDNIINELEKLPLNDKLLVIERILKSIRMEQETDFKKAVEMLHDDYKNDADLTAFTALDKEPFYESR